MKALQVPLHPGPHLLEHVSHWTITHPFPGHHTQLDCEMPRRQCSRFPGLPPCLAHASDQHTFVLIDGWLHGCDPGYAQGVIILNRMRQKQNTGTVSGRGRSLCHEEEKFIFHLSCPWHPASLCPCSYHCGSFPFQFNFFTFFSVSSVGGMAILSTGRTQGLV